MKCLWYLSREGKDVSCVAWVGYRQPDSRHCPGPYGEAEQVLGCMPLLTLSPS